MSDTAVTQPAPPTVPLAGRDYRDGVDSAIFAAIVTTLSNVSGMALDGLVFLVVAKITARQVWQTGTVEVF